MADGCNLTPSPSAAAQWKIKYESAAVFHTLLQDVAGDLQEGPGLTRPELQEGPGLTRPDLQEGSGLTRAPVTGQNTQTPHLTNLSQMSVPAAV